MPRCLICGAQEAIECTCRYDRTEAQNREAARGNRVLSPAEIQQRDARIAELLERLADLRQQLADRDSERAEFVAYVDEAKRNAGDFNDYGGKRLPDTVAEMHSEVSRLRAENARLASDAKDARAAARLAVERVRTAFDEQTRFLAGLNLQDHPTRVQIERAAVVHRAMELLRPPGARADNAAMDAKVEHAAGEDAIDCIDEGDFRADRTKLDKFVGVDWAATHEQGGSVRVPPRPLGGGGGGRVLGMVTHINGKALSAPTPLKVTR